jgi:hypothetical protein
MSPSGEAVRGHGPGAKAYESSTWVEAATHGEVRYRIAKVSVARRIELARRIREIGRRIEFLEAGGAQDKLEAMVLSAEIDRVYLEWGLEAVEGLTIDGEAATPQLLIEKGPADLAEEILRRVKAECGLSEDERKN